MKTHYALLWSLVMLASVCGYRSFAQIPNASFENWSGGDPVSWNTSNAVVVNITQTSASHSGSAVHGVVATFGGGFAWPPAIISGTNAEGFPVNTQYPALHGWYKSSPLTNDVLFVTVGMNHADSTVGAGGLTTSTTQSTYREFVVNIFYTSPQVPDTCIIAASITGQGGGLAHVGSTFDFDDLAFGPAVAVDEYGNVLPTSFELLQNYPNPFNPTTFITYSIPQTSPVQLRVFNTLGQEVAVLVYELQGAGVYRAELNGANLPSGTYFYRLQAGEFSQVKKLLLVK